MKIVVVRRDGTVQAVGAQRRKGYTVIFPQVLVASMVASASERRQDAFLQDQVARRSRSIA